MCSSCDYNILNEAYEALEPVFKQYGQYEVIQAIHDHFHYAGKDNNVTQATLWDRGFGE